MRLKCVILLICLIELVNIGMLKAQEASDFILAKSYFSELDSLCKVDNGSLWAKNLYGASMFVFPTSRLIIANEVDIQGKLIPKDGLYIGKLPENINIANTAFDWDGKSWTMLNWNAISKTDKYSRDKLLIHESWHRNQTEIGIPSVMSANMHLDELQGSILLKLEFLTLIKALNAEQKADRIAHLRYALMIKKYRQLIYPKNNENEFELHEGMAEFTGFMLCGLDKKLLPLIVAKQLDQAIDKDALANSFAYLTGPAYGILFNTVSNNWLEKTKKGNNLLEIGQQIIGKQILLDTLLLKNEVTNIINHYHAESLVKTETDRFEHQLQLVAEYEQKYLEGNQLIIKNNNLQFTFNPQEKLTSIGMGVVYKTMRLSGEWGVVEVKNGIMRTNDWQIFILPAPMAHKKGTIVENDYKLVLNNAWEVVKIREGKYTLMKK